MTFKVFYSCSCRVLELCLKTRGICLSRMLSFCAVLEFITTATIAARCKKQVWGVKFRGAGGEQSRTGRALVWPWTMAMAPDCLTIIIRCAYRALIRNRSLIDSFHVKLPMQIVHSDYRILFVLQPKIM